MYVERKAGKGAHAVLDLVAEGGVAIHNLRESASIDRQGAFKKNKLFHLSQAHN